MTFYRATILIVLFALVSIVLATTSEDCPGCHEVWNDCHPPQGGCFERACGDIPLEGTACKAPCKPGCYCGIGFIRQAANERCIPESKCPDTPEP